MPDQISTASAAAPSPAAIAAAGSQPAGAAPPSQFDKDMFLQLMVAQLKYQNPMSPMDSSEFMAQTAQFTSVEKLTELTEQLTASLANDRMSTATSMLGRAVTFTGLGGQEQTATVAGVRMLPTGPVLRLADGGEVGLADVVEVTER